MVDIETSVLDQSYLNTEELINIYQSMSEKYPEYPADNFGLIQKFIDWHASSDKFNAILFVAIKYNFFKARPALDILPKINLDSTFTKKMRDEISQKAMIGSSVIFASPKSVDSLTQYFKEFGFKETERRKTPLSESSIFDVSSKTEKEHLLSALNQAFLLRSKTLCLFSHDGDPLYLINKLI